MTCDLVALPWGFASSWITMLELSIPEVLHLKPFGLDLSYSFNGHLRHTHHLEPISPLVILGI